MFEIRVVSAGQVCRCLPRPGLHLAPSVGEQCKECKQCKECPRGVHSHCLLVNLCRTHCLLACNPKMSTSPPPARALFFSACPLRASNQALPNLPTSQLNSAAAFPLADGVNVAVLSVKEHQPAHTHGLILLPQKYPHRPIYSGKNT